MSSLLRQRTGAIFAAGVLAFVLLALRFSPNWVEFNQGLHAAEAEVSTAAERAAIRKSFLSDYAALRGVYVARQVAHPNVEIDDLNHKIIRWRLLMPALGYFLRLPVRVVLGLAPLGCLALIIAFAGIGSARTAPGDRPFFEALCLGVVAGASAPFFTSMGWLGYYDSWLALGLLGVAFARPRGIVVLACLLTPWIDERFVIGLPLALCVRWTYFEPAAEARLAWLKIEILPPLWLAIAYAILRLELGGSGGSQTLTDYLRHFVLTEQASFAQRLFGAWQGLRIDWLLVFFAILAAPGLSFRTRGWHASLLAAAVVICAVCGIYSAEDFGRSMVLILPVVPLGWLRATRNGAWRRFHLAPILAAAALLVPASHVSGNLVRPVDALWAPSAGLLGGETNVGTAYANGNGVAKDPVAAVKWFRAAAEQEFAPAQFDLGVMYATGNGVRQESAEAVRWYRKAAAQGLASAECSLGIMASTGNGMPANDAEAVQWYRRAAEQGFPEAQSNLGYMYQTGRGVLKDAAQAVRWYREATAHDYPQAESNLAFMYETGTGVPKDGAESVKLYSEAAAQGLADAEYNLGLIYATGVDVPEDDVTALAYLDLAAARGYIVAMKDRDKLEKILGEQKAAVARELSKELVR